MRQLIGNTVIQISSQHTRLYLHCVPFSKKYHLSFSKWPFSIDTISHKRKAHALLFFQIILGYETGRGSIRWRGRIERLTHLGEAANSIKSITEKGGRDIHLPLLCPNESKQPQEEQNPPLSKMEMGLRTWMHIWSDAARNHPIPS